MNLSIDIEKKLTLENFIVFASLPDIGKVGGLVSEFLVKELQAEKFGEIRILEKPWVKNDKGIVTPVVDIFGLFVNMEKKIIVLTGKEQPQDPNNLFKLVINFLNLLKDIGSPKLIYTSGGYYQPQLTESPKVYGISNNETLNASLKEQGINLFDNEIEIITWFNGIILGIAKEMDIKAVGLFGEISETNERQPLAAKAIIKIFSKLENISINTEKFDNDYENQILEKIKDKDRNNNKSNNRFSGPGIA